MNALRKHLCVISAYAVITAALTWPLPLHLADGLLAAQSGDPLLQVWVIQWNIHKLTTSLSRYFDANIFYPYLNTFAYHDHLFGLSLLGLPVQMLGRSPLLTFNALFLLSFALSAYSTFLLADALCRNRYAGLAAQRRYDGSERIHHGVRWSDQFRRDRHQPVITSSAYTSDMTATSLRLA